MDFKPVCDICGADNVLESGYYGAMFEYKDVHCVDFILNNSGTLQPCRVVNLCEDCKRKMDVYIQAMRLSNDMKKGGGEDE